MADDLSIAREQWERFVYCRDNGHARFVAKADRCRDFTVGRQWRPEDSAVLREERRPALTINKTMSTVETILGEQIHNRTEVLFRPRAGSPAGVADALSKVWMQVAQNNQLIWTRSAVFANGVVTGRGFYEVRLDFSDSMQGDVSIDTLNPKNVLIDPDAEEYDPDRWADVILTKWLTWQEVSLLYGQDAARELRARADASAGYGNDALDDWRDRFAGSAPAFGRGEESGHKEGVARSIRVLVREHRQLVRQPHFVDLETGEFRPVPESWDEARRSAMLARAGGRMSVIERPARRIRWTATAGDLVLMDEWSPYRHFSVVPYFPFFMHGETCGVVEHLLDPQELLNKVTSQELHVVNTTANSGWIVEENSIVNMSMAELAANGARTGVVLEVRKGAQMPVKISPNQVPTGLDRLSWKAEEYIKAISNVSDSMQGFDREDVAAKAIAYKQQRSSINMSKSLDNLERTDYILARNVLDIVQAYYTEPRLLNITHDDIAREQESVEINTPDPATGEIVNDLTLGEYDIIITSAPYRASLEDSQFEQALAMRKEGIQLPDAVLIENSRLMRRAEILKGMRAEQESPAARQREELALRGMRAEVAQKEAEVERTRADAGKKAADAEMKGVDAATKGEEARLKAGMDMQKLLLEMRTRQEELAMRQQETDMKLAAQQEKMRLDAEERAQERLDRQRQAEQEAALQRARQYRDEAAGKQSPIAATEDEA